MDKAVQLVMITVNTKEGGNDAIEFYNGLENLYDSYKELDIRYICGQLEQGTTLHFQGYIQMKRRQRISWYKKHVHPHAHFDVQRGTNDQCQHYTKKPVEGCLCDHCQSERLTPTKLPEYPWLEFGKFTAGQGSRTDLENARDAIASGSNRMTLWTQHSTVYAKYPKYVETGFTLHSKHAKIEDKQVILHYGHPEKGKTEGVVDSNPDLWIMPFGAKLWFDGYDDQEVALFDEFGGRDNPIDLKTFLMLGDRIVKRVEVKGGFVMFKAKTIHITTNIHPLDWYSYIGRIGAHNCVKRRLTKILWYGEEHTYGDEPLDVTEDESFWYPGVDVRMGDGIVNPYKF